MSDITLVSINWNQRRVMELMLKSFVKTMWIGTPFELMLVDNGSNDDSKKWLTENEIPFIDSPINMGHETAVNMVYKKINTRYCLLVDTDIQFRSAPYDYVSDLDDECLAAGDLITGDHLNISIKPRIGAWFFLFDIAKMKSLGIKKFRDTTDWSYDVGSWMTEKILEHGTIRHIARAPGDIDRDVLGMDYGTHIHLGKMSWELTHHQDRQGEVLMRRKYVEDQLKLYEDIDLKGKFI